jgi:hypothetical protein
MRNKSPWIDSCFWENLKNPSTGIVVTFLGNEFYGLADGSDEAGNFATPSGQAGLIARLQEKNG